MRTTLIAFCLLAGCLSTAGDPPALEPGECEGEPNGERSRLPTHAALLDPAAPERLREEMGGGEARARTSEMGTLLEWKTRGDLRNMTPEKAEALVHRALTAVGLDGVEWVDWRAWRDGDGPAVQAHQAWRHLRVDGVRFYGTGGTPGNESTLRIGPILDFSTAHHPAITQREAERTAAPYLECTRRAAESPPGDVSREGLFLDQATLVWAFAYSGVHRSCGWADRVHVDAFTGEIVWAGASCMT